jgi:hypothetical protein
MAAKKKAPKELIDQRPVLEAEEEVLHPSTGPNLGPPPRQYTRALHERLCEELRKGQRAQGACARAGITVATFYDWVRKGKNGDPHLWEFAQDVEIAFNTAEANAVDAITKTFTEVRDDAKPDTENAKWMLERTRAEGYSKQVKTAVESQVKEFMIRLEAALPEAVFEQVLAVYLGQSPGSQLLESAHEPEAP